MRSPTSIGFSFAAFLVFAGCNQPFEPDGPPNSKLVVYSILNAASDTQYVRVGTTFENPPGPEVTGATVVMETNGHTIPFRDTTLVRATANGSADTLHAYIAYHQAVTPGNFYQLVVTTPDGRSVSASAQALLVPTIALQDAKILDRSGTAQITLNTLFRSLGGAFVAHFYLDYYAFVDGGWELHRTEVPLSRTYDAAGNPALTYPALSLVRGVATAQKTLPIIFDTLLYAQTRSDIIQEYPAAPVIWLQGVFVLTQIDDVLYNYYYVNNGPVDRSSIRLDQPDYTNIPRGLGVFGSSVTVTQSYPITR
jgi:hypothetical protein